MKVTPEGMPWRVEIAANILSAVVGTGKINNAEEARMYSRRSLAWADILIDEHEKEYPPFVVSKHANIGDTIYARLPGDDKLTSSA